MKIFAFFLAMIVLVQSVLPCSDTGLVSRTTKAKTEIAKATHSQGTEKADDCSPFCQCACCAGFSINHFIASIDFIPVHESKPQSAHLPSETFEIALPIWQPPQLV